MMMKPSIRARFIRMLVRLRARRRLLRRCTGDHAAQHDARLQVDLLQHRLEDLAAGILEIDVDAVRAFALQRGADVFLLVVDAGVEAEILDQVAALLVACRRCRRRGSPSAWRSGRRWSRPRRRPPRRRPSRPPAACRDRAGRNRPWRRSRRARSYRRAAAPALRHLLRAVDDGSIPASRRSRSRCRRACSRDCSTARRRRACRRASRRRCSPAACTAPCRSSRCGWSDRATR